MSPDTLQIAREAVAEIAARFPTLRMTMNEGDPVGLSLTIPVQPDVKQEVRLCLQNNDELHFSVGHFGLEWFPCTEPKRVKEYIDAVSGFLAGRYRVLEHCRGKRCVKAELQTEESGAWRTIGTWSLMWPPVPWRKTFREVKNV